MLTILTQAQTDFIGSYKLDWNAGNASKRTGFELKPCEEIAGYFVYALIDPVTSEIFYVGKGGRKRWRDHERDARNGWIRNPRKHARITIILKAGHSPCAVFLAVGLTSKHAQNIELAFIRGIGRKRLTNAMAGVPSKALRVIQEAQYAMGQIKSVTRLILEGRSKADIAQRNQIMVDLHEAMQLAESHLKAEHANA